MIRMVHYLLLFVVFTLFQSCGTEVDPPPPPEPEPYFKEGEYGGEELPRTEHFTQIKHSPDGQRVALIRKYTPNQSDPLYQLWIMDADGSNPELISYNVRNVDWHPDGNELAFTFNPHTTPYTYVFTLNLETEELRLWNSKEELFFDKYTSGTTGWLSDGERLIIAVNGKAYQQTYARGTYFLNTTDTTHVGPFKELLQATYMGNNEAWIVGFQYGTQENPELSSNRALLNLETNEFKWLTTYDSSSDSLRVYTGIPIPNPAGPEIILPRYVENAWQLFQINEEGENVEQLTELGGHEVTWTRGKDFFIFNRDTHKAPGAKYIPYIYNFPGGTEKPLWPNLPDSVPSFPEFSTQNPIHLINYVD